MYLLFCFKVLYLPNLCFKCKIYSNSNLRESNLIDPDVHLKLLS